MARRGRIIGLPEGQFIVPEPATQFLEAEGLAYDLHEWMSEDHVTQTLRNSTPHPA